MRMWVLSNIILNIILQILDGKFTQLLSSKPEFIELNPIAAYLMGIMGIYGALIFIKVFPILILVWLYTYIKRLSSTRWTEVYNLKLIKLFLILLPLINISYLFTVASEISWILFGYPFSPYIIS